MFETKASRVPSGENDGDVHDPVFAIKATVRSNSSGGAVSAPAIGASQTHPKIAAMKPMFFMEFSFR
jgi:hypothetical protein